MSKDIALLLLRLAGLGLAIGHGWAKVTALATGGGERLVSSVAQLGFPMPALFAWAAALSEFGGGLLVALGLGTRVAAAFAAFSMSVAGFLRHRVHLHVLAVLGLYPASPDDLKNWGNPEVALMYLAVLLAIIFMGPGRLSLDQMLFRRKKR